MDYAQIANTARNPMAAGELRGANVATEVRALDGLLDRLTEELHAMAENASRISQFKNRLVNPRPQGVNEKPTAAPIASSIESRLQDIINMAHNIGAQLNETANELDRAA